MGGRGLGPAAREQLLAQLGWGWGRHRESWMTRPQPRRPWGLTRQPASQFTDRP